MSTEYHRGTAHSAVSRPIGLAPRLPVLPLLVSMVAAVGESSAQPVQLLRHDLSVSCNAEIFAYYPEEGRAQETHTVHSDEPGLSLLQTHASAALDHASAYAEPTLSVTHIDLPNGVQTTVLAELDLRASIDNEAPSDATASGEATTGFHVVVDYFSESALDYTLSITTTNLSLLRNEGFMFLTSSGASHPHAYPSGRSPVAQQFYGSLLGRDCRLEIDANAYARSSLGPDGSDYTVRVQESGKVIVQIVLSLTEAPERSTPSISIISSKGDRVELKLSGLLPGRHYTLERAARLWKEAWQTDYWFWALATDATIEVKVEEHSPGEFYRLRTE